MKVVTYDAGAGPRVGVLDGEDVIDAGFEGDRVAFIESGAAAADLAGARVTGARLLAPLRPRTLRDFLGFEGHLRNAAYRNLGRDIPPEWYEMCSAARARSAWARARPRTGTGRNVLGPCIVTADEFDASDARMRVRVNGELWGEDTTAHMHHTFADMIAYASRSQTLRPGEVIGSGTAAGESSLDLGRRLHEGDVVELEVEGIGVLRNRIGRKGA
jgi:hypothetical protein